MDLNFRKGDINPEKSFLRLYTCNGPPAIPGLSDGKGVAAAAAAADSAGGGDREEEL